MPQEAIQPIQPMSPMKPIGGISLGSRSTPRFGMPRQAAPQMGPPVPQASPLEEKPEWMRSVGSYDNERGWFDQNIHDVWSILSGIPQVVAQAGKNIVNGEVTVAIDDIVSSMFRDPEVLAAATKRVTKDLLYGATEHYRNPQNEYTLESVATAPIRRPFLVALDALMLASGGTAAGLKMTRPMAALAKAAGVSPMRFVRGWTRGLKAAQALPAKAFAAGISAAEKLPGVSHLEKALAISPKGRKWAAELGSQRLRAVREAHDTQQELILSKIPPELHEEFVSINNRVKPWDVNAHTPEFNKRVKDWADAMTYERDALKEEGFKLASGPVTDEAFEQAALKHAADELGISVDEAKGVVANTLAETARLSGPEAAATQAKLFKPAVIQHGFDVADALHSMFEPVGATSLRRTGPLERFRGKRKYAIDPDTYQTNYLVSMANLKGTKRGYESILLNEPEAKLMPRLKPGEPIPPGMEDLVELPHYLTPRYIDDQITALGKLNASVAKHQRLGLSAEEARKAAWAETAMGLMPKAYETQGILGGKELTWYVPKELARFIEYDLAPSGGFTKLYEKFLLNPWRDLVLSWSPRYYINNLMGNSALMLFFGIPPSWQKGRNFANIAHEAERATLRMEGEGFFNKLGQSAPMKWARRVQDQMAFRTDAIPRIEMLNSFAGKAAEEMRAADKIANPFIQTLEGSTPRLDEIKQAMMNVRERALAIEGKLLTIGGQGLGEAERAIISSKAKGLATEAGYLPKGEIGPRGPKGTSPSSFTKRMTAQQMREAVEASGHYQDYLNAIKPLREPFEKAIRDMELVLGPYGRTTPFARRYLRRVLPFWTFASTMAQLAFWAPFMRPKTTWLYSNIAQMAQEAMDDERLPDWLRGAMWVGGDGQGKMNFVRLSGLNLMDSLSFRKVGGVPLPKLIDPTQNPFFVVAHKMAGGYDQFTHEPPPVEGYQWQDNHGRVWELRDRKFERVSPETKMWDAFGELIPQLSALNDILAQVGVKVPGAGPKLYVGPDGKKFSPRHWLIGLNKLIGFNTGQVDINKTKEMDQRNTLRLARQFGKAAMMNPDPVERGQILKELAEMERRFRRRGYQDAR